MQWILIMIAKALLFIVYRCVYGSGTNHMKGIMENHGQNCYNPTSSMWFLKCIGSFINKDYTEEFRDFIKNEKY